MIENQKTTISKWRELNLFFKGRTTSPIDHPEFIVYFLLVIFGFGAIGVWSSFIPNNTISFDHSNLINNIASFSVAIIATGSIELMFAENDIIRKTLLFISLSIIVLSVILYLILFNTESIYFYWLAVPFGFVSLYIWWIANADNANLTQSFFVKQSDESSKLNNSLNDYDE